MLKPPDIDPAAVRRQFSRRAAGFADADFLCREIEQRMFDRLELIKLAPGRLLDVGCGLGRGLAVLAERFPKALLTGVDSAAGMLTRNRFAPAPVTAGLAQRLLQLPGRVASQLTQQLTQQLSRQGGQPASSRVSLLAADAGALPLPATCIDLLWSNLAWHWFNDPPAVAAEWRRVIRPGGVLMFSAFGVDTLRELRKLGAQLPEFPDLHDIGDLLGQSGFVDPVMDTERLTVSYDNPDKLMADWHAMAGNASAGRRRGLATPAQKRVWAQSLAGLKGGDGRIHVSVEIVYAHAWRGADKAAQDDYQPITWVPKSQIRRKIG